MHRTRQISGLLVLIMAMSSPAAPGVTAAVPPVSPTPTVTVVGGSQPQQARLDQALARFAEAGLDLPDLEIGLSAGTGPCRGHMALFGSHAVPWQITICSEADFVYEHELAHAWEAANLTEDIRAEFMDFRGYETWAGPSVEWSERGIEGVAFVIQQGLLDGPLPKRLSEEQESRLAAYQLLTGTPSPRLES